MAERSLGQRLATVPGQAIIILGLSLLATFAAWRWTAQQGEGLAQFRFQVSADEAAAELRGRMDDYKQTLLSGVALLEASEHVGRAEWAKFVARLDVAALLPGTQGIGYAVRVDAEALAAHEAAIRGEGFADYTVRPPGPRPETFPIVFLEPFTGRNLRAFGYDMFSDPIRREAMERARDTGTAAMSGTVVLVQETDRDVQAGVLAYLPFYGGDQPAEIAGRRAALRGFVYAPLRMGDLARAVLGEERLANLCVRLYDGRVDESALLFANAECVPGEHEAAFHLEVFGRDWLMQVRSTPMLDRTVASRRSSLILGAGSIISFLLMWAVAAMLAERRRRMALGRALAELEAARAEAAGANAAKGRFLAAASHDLRQPLQSLGIFLHILIGQRAATGDVERSAQEAYEATARMVDAMFDIAALDSGRANPIIRRFPLGALLNRIAEENRPDAEARGLSLRTRLCQVEVATDEVMLERIVRNLVNNALKYTASGGVLIACRATPRAVRIKVADSGPGVPDDKRDLIFEDFYQIDNPERDARKGLGLGLATVARLSRLLDFRLHVLSRPGMGSTFVLEIPREETRAPSAAAL